MHHLNPLLFLSLTAAWATAEPTVTKLNWEQGSIEVVADGTTIQSVHASGPKFIPVSGDLAEAPRGEWKIRYVRGQPANAEYREMPEGGGKSGNDKPTRIATFNATGGEFLVDDRELAQDLANVLANAKPPHGQAAGSALCVDVISPNHRLGVTIPPLIFESNPEPIKEPTKKESTPKHKHVSSVASDEDQSENQLIDLTSRRVVATLPGWTAETKMNHGGHGGNWSKDGDLLLWMVYGKWSSDTVAVVKLKQGKPVWIKNVTPASQRAILAGVKKAAPKAYARERRDDEEYRTAYPEGFTVDVTTDIGEDEAPRLPMKIFVNLTSNPKGIEGHTTLDAWLDGILAEDGKLTFGKVHLGQRPGLHNAWAD